MKVAETMIEDTFAEAFTMRFARLIVTADDDYWLDACLRELTGYSASVISCDAEVGVERRIDRAESPDGRSAAAVLIFAMSRGALQKAITNRVGQCLMTCPTTAAFDGLPAADERLALGKHLRFFGDGFQKSKIAGTTRYWRVPVMDGEFLVIDKVGCAKGVGGGNLILQGVDQPQTLAAAKLAAIAISDLPGVITPFPGGVVRSGSKVGSRYPGLVASTADAYCPTLRGRTESQLHPDANCAYEIVIDGDSYDSVAEGMKVGMQAGTASGILAITAGNYGGKLGKHLFALRELVGG
ncbi:MAG: formylmethanofuran--tetrahydromethanopterin N-formyltransferase [Pirellulaceae bacterium]